MSTKPKQIKQIKEIKEKSSGRVGTSDKVSVDQVKISDQKNEIKNIESYILYLRTIQASAIRTLSEALREVLTDLNIHFDQSGLRITAMDTNQVSFVYLQLKADKFENYHCPNHFSIGINMISLHKLLKTISNLDIITLFISKDDKHKLGIKIENKEKKIESVSKLKLLDIDNAGIKIPDIKFETVFQMSCSDFQKHCRDLSAIAEEVDINVKNNGEFFTMYASGDFAEQEIKIGNQGNDSDQEGPGSTIQNTYIGKFPLKYLNLFCKASGLCPAVDIFLHENYPVLVQYSVANLGTIRFGLSPIAQRPM